jgi:hypothetical protein
MSAEKKRAEADSLRAASAELRAMSRGAATVARVVADAVIAGARGAIPEPLKDAGTLLVGRLAAVAEATAGSVAARLDREAGERDARAKALEEFADELEGKTASAETTLAAETPMA